MDNTPPEIIFDTPGTHTVYLIAENAAGERDTASLSIEVLEAPTADFSFQVTNDLVAFGNLSANANAYEWHFGDGTTSPAAGPTNTYSSPGTYTVLLIASNGYCADTASQAVQIGNPPSGGIVLDLGEAEGSAGETVLVPVIIRGVFDTLISVQGTAEFLAAGVGRFIGYEPGALGGNIAVNQGQFAAYTPLGLPVGAADTLFYFRVELIGNPGDMSEMAITGNPTPLEITILENDALAFPDYTTETGKVTILENASVDGNITFWSTGAPVRDVRVSLDVAQTPADPDAQQVTGADGRYRFDDISLGSDVTLSCLKDINVLNGVTTAPLFYVQEYIVGGSSPNITSPYQLIAADANCDDAPTTGDLAIIQRVIVGLASDFSPCNSWAFVRADANLTLSNPLPYPSLYNLPVLGGDIAVDFIGVKVGDILGAASPQNRGMGPLDHRNLGALPLLATNRPATAGEILTLELRSGSFQHIGSLQFALEYDPQRLEFLGFDAAQGALLPVHHASADEGLIRLSWLDRSARGISFPADQAALRPRFRALVPVASLREAVRIAPLAMKPEALNATGEEFTVELDWESVADAAGKEQAAGYRLYQNVPNPARNRTSIRFLLPRAESGAIHLIGPLGQVVAEYKGGFRSGYNEVELITEGLRAGIYHYRLTTPHFTGTGSMVVQ
ncbi:MAG: PKD domain-containing protein [Phaeodactylibacter sp.]|nr:PKD domain-containing protein [Phaeodactylibacter sp.]